MEIDPLLFNYANDLQKTKLQAVVDHGISLGNVMVCRAYSLKAYEALPEDIKAIFREVEPDWYDVVIDEWWTIMVEAKDAMKAGGVEFVQFSTEDNKLLREKAKEVAKEYIDEIEEQGIPGIEAYDALQSIMEKHGLEPQYYDSL